MAVVSNGNVTEKILDVVNTNKEFDFDITSNWQVLNEKNLRNCVSIQVSDNKDSDSAEVDDIVSLESCVCLSSKPNEEFCRIEIKLNNCVKICQIAIVSEASLLEFYKQYGEYVKTVQAECVDEFEDNVVYKAELVLTPNCSECSIKLIRPKNRSQLWIYGIKLFCSSMKTNSFSNSYNIEVIQDCLTTLNQQKPDKLEMTKRMVESFSNSKTMPNEKDMLSLLALMKNPSRDNNGHAQTNGANNSTHNFSADSSDLKLYIDDKINSMEKRLIHRIEVVEEKVNQKLDQILKILETNH